MLAREAVPLGARRGPRPCRRRARQRRSATVRELGDGRLCRPGCGYAGNAADRRQGRRRAARDALARLRERRWRSLRAASFPTEPTPSSPSSSCRPRQQRGGPSAVGAGDNVRGRGGDVASGELVVRAGTRLGPAQLGALAAAGVATVPVARRPRVAVLTTGTELRAPGEPLGPGRDLRVERDDAGGAASGLRRRRRAARPRGRHEDAHREAIGRGLEADVLVTTGGVSVGPHDLVRRIEGELGVEEVFWRVALRPGKPVAVRRARRDARVRPARQSRLVARRLRAVRQARYPRAPGPRRSRPAARCPAGSRKRCVRAMRARSSCGPGSTRGAEGWCSRRSSGQESHMIVRSAAADALVLVPRRRRVAAGGRRRALSAARLTERVDQPALSGQRGLLVERAASAGTARRTAEAPSPSPRPAGTHAASRPAPRTAGSARAACTTR